MRKRRQIGPFPPKDFVPTAIVFGFWVAAVMAGVNHIRLGDVPRGRRFVVSGVIAYLLVRVLLSLTVSSQSHQSVLYFRSGEPMIGTSTAAFGLTWQFLLACVINGAVGYGLYRLQRGAYAEWAENTLQMNGRAPMCSGGRVCSLLQGL
jgi:hypothetical protein